MSSLLDIYWVPLIVIRVYQFSRKIANFAMRLISRKNCKPKFLLQSISRNRKKHCSLVKKCSFHSVEISWFFYHSFCGFYKCKICHFNTFRGSEFWILCIFALFEPWNLPNYQIHGPKNGKNSIFRTSSFSKIDFT